MIAERELFFRGFLAKISNFLVLFRGFKASLIYLYMNFVMNILYILIRQSMCVLAMITSHEPIRAKVVLRMIQSY